MDGIKQRLTEFLKQYKFVVIIIAVGILLMLLPSGKEETVQQTNERMPAADLESDLEAILSQIHGAGRVHVLLTEDRGEEYLYEYNQDAQHTQEHSDLRQQVVVITDSQRGQQGLIRQVRSPAYRGAVVVCQGGDLASVRLAVVEAVSNATGLTSDKITVLKMK